MKKKINLNQIQIDKNEQWAVDECAKWEKKNHVINVLRWWQQCEWRRRKKCSDKKDAKETSFDAWNEMKMVQLIMINLCIWNRCAEHRRSEVKIRTERKKQKKKTFTKMVINKTTTTNIIHNTSNSQMNRHQNGQLTNGKNVDNYAQEIRIEQYKASLFRQITKINIHVLRHSPNEIETNSIERKSECFFFFFIFFFF